MTETISIDDRAGDLPGVGFATGGEITEFFAGAQPSIAPEEPIFPQFAEAELDDPTTDQLSERSIQSDDEPDLALTDVLEASSDPADFATTAGEGSQPANGAPTGNGIFVPFEPAAPFIGGLAAEGVLPAT